MREIALTQGKVAIVDDEDFEYLNHWKWYCSSRGYARSNAWDGKKGYTISMHRLVNHTPNGYQTHHVNGDTLDNRKSNLRTVTATQHHQSNQRLGINNHSGYRGVGWNKNTHKWRARIQKDGKLIHLGLFDTPQEANKTYLQAAKELYGEFFKELGGH